MADNKEEIYKTVSALIDSWLENHNDETFDLDYICRHLEISSREGRTQVSNKLNYLVKKKFLSKHNHIYRYINKVTKGIEWVDIKDSYLGFAFPSNHQESDLTYFSFANSVRLSEGSLVVIAGVGNGGKSVTCRNILWDNMHNYPTLYMSSETTGASFRRYAQNMTWQNPLGTDGKPVFTLIERYRDFQDVVQDGHLNIIDWLDIESGEYYRIGQELKEIKEQNPHGITVVSIQKDPQKELGRGATFGKELASVYLTIDYDSEHDLRRMKVVKAKEWVGNIDPNNKIFGFNIVNFGSQFANIREIKKCKHCYGSGRSHGADCVDCNGVGWIDVYSVRKSAEEEMGIEF